MKTTPPPGPAPRRPGTTGADRSPDRPQRRVLDAVAAGGPGGRTVAGLTEALGGHENTVRHHLAALVADGLVAARPDRAAAGRGRPAVRYRLTDRGGSALAARHPAVEEYVALAGAFAQRLAERGGAPEDEARAVGRAWGAALDGADVSGGAEPVGRVLAALTRLGFSPAPDAAGSGTDATLVLLRTCPLLDAARRHPEVVCQVHHGLVEGLLDAGDQHAVRGPGGGPGPARPVGLEPFARPGACVLRLPVPQR